MRLLPAGVVAFGILPILAFAASAQQDGFSVVTGSAPRLVAAEAAPVPRNTLHDIPATPTPRPSIADTPPMRHIAPPTTQYGAQVIAFPGNVAGAFDVTYATLPGFRPLTLDLYTPRPSDTPRPLVVFVHGGSWDSGDSRHAAPFPDFPRALATLAAQGYVVASVNYRLSQEARYPAAVQDVKAAIRWLRGRAQDFNIDRIITDDLAHVVEHDGQHPWSGNDKCDKYSYQFRNEGQCLFVDLCRGLKNAYE